MVDNDWMDVKHPLINRKGHVVEYIYSLIYDHMMSSLILPSIITLNIVYLF